MVPLRYSPPLKEGPMENLPEMEDPSSQGRESSSQFKQRFKLSALEILFGSLILLGLLYIGYFIFFQESTGTNSKLEKKIKTMEASVLEQTEKFDKNVKAIQSNQAQMESRLKALEIANRDLLAKFGRTEKRPAEEKNPTPGKEKIQYKAKKGETLRIIAKKFKVSPDDLARWNKRDKNKPIRTGETLVILPR
jgi:LysM repeat protein